MLSYMVAGGLIHEDASGCKALMEEAELASELSSRLSGSISNNSSSSSSSSRHHAVRVFAFALDMLRTAVNMVMPNGEPLQIRIGECDSVTV